MVPGRRSPSSLKKHADSSNSGISLDVPANIFSKSALQKLGEMKKNESAVSAEPKKKESQDKTPGQKPPATVTTVSEKAVIPQPKKDESSLQKESKPLQDKSGMIKPSQVKVSGFKPIDNKPVQEVSSACPPPVKLPQIERLQGHKPLPGKILPPPGAHKPVSRVQQIQQQTFTGSEDLESVDFVRRPTRPAPRQDSQEERFPVATPVIAVTPSTPAPPETPVPDSPINNIRIPSMPPHGKSPLSLSNQVGISEAAKPVAPKPSEKLEATRPTEKPGAPKPVEKSAAPKPAEKSVVPKPAEKPEAHKPSEKSEAPKQEEKPKAPKQEKPEAPKQEKPEAPKQAEKPEAPKQAEKPAAPKASQKPEAPKPAAPQPSNKTSVASSQGQKPSTPPAAAFQGNEGANQNEPLITSTKPKKGNWL